MWKMQPAGAVKGEQKGNSHICEYLITYLLKIYLKKNLNHASNAGIIHFKAILFYYKLIVL